MFIYNTWIIGKNYMWKNNLELPARVGRLNAQLIEIPWLTPKECIMKGLAMLRLNAIGWIEKDARRRVARK